MGRRRRKRGGLSRGFWFARNLVFLVCALVGVGAYFTHSDFAVSKPASWPARVVHVSDGDTVTVTNERNHQKYRVRLQGVDSPEVDHGRGRPGQPFGPVAKRFMTKLLAGARVVVHPSGDTSYDRIVGRIFKNGHDVAVRLVRAGMAWDYPHYDPRHIYTAYQRTARQASVGLWAGKNPTPPWRWRHQVWTR